MLTSLTPQWCIIISYNYLLQYSSKNHNHAMNSKRGSEIDIAFEDGTDVYFNAQRFKQRSYGGYAAVNTVKFAALVVVACISSRLGTFIAVPNDNGHLRNQKQKGSDFIRYLKDSLDSESVFFPIILTNNGKLLCPSEKRIKDTNVGRNNRLNHFREMLHAGLQAHHRRLISKYGHLMNEHLPLLLATGDDIGCDVSKHVDNFLFPRLTWSMPSKEQHRGDEWCHTVGVPSYESCGIDFQASAQAVP